MGPRTHPGALIKAPCRIGGFRFHSVAAGLVLRARCGASDCARSRCSGSAAARVAARRRASPCGPGGVSPPARSCSSIGLPSPARIFFVSALRPRCRAAAQRRERAVRTRAASCRPSGRTSERPLGAPLRSSTTASGALRWCSDDAFTVFENVRNGDRAAADARGEHRAREPRDAACPEPVIDGARRHWVACVRQRRREPTDAILADPSGELRRPAPVPGRSRWQPVPPLVPCWCLGVVQCSKIVPLDENRAAGPADGSPRKDPRPRPPAVSHVPVPIGMGRTPGCDWCSTPPRRLCRRRSLLSQRRHRTRWATGRGRCQCE
jgi:hypothetical protein